MATKIPKLPKKPEKPRLEGSKAAVIGHSIKNAGVLLFGGGAMVVGSLGIKGVQKTGARIVLSTKDSMDALYSQAEKIVADVDNHREYKERKKAYKNAERMHEHLKDLEAKEGEGVKYDQEIEDEFQENLNKFQEYADRAEGKTSEERAEKEEPRRKTARQHQREAEEAKRRENEGGESQAKTA